MEHKRGTPREQITLFPEAVDDYISKENPVRFIDTFVDKVDAVGVGFKHAQVAVTGTPPYDPKDLLKLYIYGYLNRIRTSRLLERETKRNVEVMWLMRRLSPDHKTISDFRKDHPDALKGVFKNFVVLCKELELFGAELVAVDSSKFKASNARDKVVDTKGIERLLRKIEESIAEYLKELDKNDSKDDRKQEKKLSKEELQKKIGSLESRKVKLEEAKEELETSGEKYVSLTDKDCRLIKDKDGIEPGYRMQTSVDDKYSMIVDYEMTQDASDHNHLCDIAASAKEVLVVEELKACADAGYFNSVDLKKCEDKDIVTYVPAPKARIANLMKVPVEEYYPEKFSYDKESDRYECPVGKPLSYIGTTEKDRRKIRIYRCKGCDGCKVRDKCTTAKSGRQVGRWEGQEVIEAIKERMINEPQVFKRRKEIVEHIYGTIKNVWGYEQLLLRGLKKTASEAALMNLAYNIRRALTLLGTTKLVAHLQSG